MWQKIRTKVIIAAAVLVIGFMVLQVVKVLFPHRYYGPPSAAQAYFYEVDSGKLFKGDILELPPFPSPENPAAQAVFFRSFACGQCPDEPALSSGYLEKYEDGAKVFVEGLGIPADAPISKIREGLAKGDNLHRLIAIPEIKTQWVPEDSDKGKAIIAKATPNCPDPANPLIECRPKPAVH